jgi:hypothetical protein
MTGFRFEFHAYHLLPKLSWVAELRRGGDVVHVLHGPWVETRDDRFFEGAWDGPFAEGAFDDAVSFLGSGGRLAGDRVVFTGPTHKMDRIQSVEADGTLYFSNSLVLLLTRAGEDLDLAYPNYFFDYLNYFRKGMSIRVKPLPLRSGNRALLHDYCNVTVSRDLAIERIERWVPPEPSCYRDYADFLEKTAQHVATNSADPARIHCFEPVAAISRGYDSVAVAALASRAGCRRAVTFRHSGWRNIPDSGTEIAAALGMEVAEYNRIDYASLPGLPETEFYQYAELSAKAQSIFEDRIRGSLFFNGQAGEDYWNTSRKTGLPLLQEPTALRMSGTNLTEYRLRAGIVVFPLAVCGAIHAPAIARIGGLPEMGPWSIGGEYDRPIPRRIAEERGVPRHLFGQSKVGGGPQVGQIGLCPASDADFQKFYNEVVRGRVASGPHRAERRQPRIDWMRPFRRMISTTPWMTRVFRGLLSDRLDPRWGTMALFTFHWGFYRVRERYEEALRNRAPKTSIAAD